MLVLLTATFYILVLAIQFRNLTEIVWPKSEKYFMLVCTGVSSKKRRHGFLAQIFSLASAKKFSVVLKKESFNN